MKTAIFQYYKAKDKVPDSVRIVTSRFKRYADAIGADYIFDDECNNTGNVYFENLRVIYLQGNFGSESNMDDFFINGR